MNRFLLSTLAIFILAALVSAQTTEKTVETIRTYYNDVAEKAHLCETQEDQGEFGELVMNELTVNTKGHQWRAVGRYGQTFKFFYKAVGDDERRLYPDQIVFIKTERRSSDRTYREEFLYSEKGVLMFYFQKAENDSSVPAERRVYFSGTKTIRIIDDGKTRERFSATELKNIAEITRSSAKLKEIFTRSINL